jgi:hypothetical protein
MISLFDYYDNYDIPTFVLCNPNGDQLYTLGDISDRKVTLRFNALSELSFVAKSKMTTTSISGSEVLIDTEYFSYLEYLRLIYVPNIGYFMITGIEKGNDGIILTKTITAQSLEVDFNFKKLTLFKGTYKFYDIITPTGTLISTLLGYLPDWSVGSIDASLNNLYRTFDVTDTTIYSFLMNDVATAYQCIFTFDTLNKTISAHTVANATTTTDIYLSHNNLLENVEINHITEEMVTALAVYGGGDLDIRTVNPLGTDTIYNFSYYETTNWMSGSLITALDTWEAKIASNQTAYANLLTNLSDSYTLEAAQDTALIVLETELTGLETEQKADIQGGLSISSINAQVKAKKAEIVSKQAEIAITDAATAAIIAQMQVINNDLSFETNFTTIQRSDLSHFIRGSTYNNENFIKTDIMTSVEIQAMAQELYDQAIGVLAKVSEPRYEFSVESTNFVLLKSFKAFTDQLVLGAVITIEIEDGIHSYPALLELELDYEDPTQFKMTFGNRLRLDSSDFQLSDLLNQAVNSSISTSFNSEQWGNFNNNYKNDVSTFLTSALDASKNAVINATNQEIVINTNGLRGKYLDPLTGTYSPEQLWMTSNLLVMTDDNWDTARLALGKIIGPDGNYTYGIVADTIVGRLIAGNELKIMNDANTFIVDGAGATLTNATLTVTNQNGTSKILINPIDGITIQKYNPSLGSYTNNFYADANGNLHLVGNLDAATGTFSGNLSAPSGTIGGWTINTNGLSDNNGNYINSDGNIRLGMLTIDGNEAWFNGNIYAANLLDSVYGYQIQDIIADTITAGTINGINIHGSRISWGNTIDNPAAWMDATPTGVAEIVSTSNILMELRNGAGYSKSFIELGNSGILIGGGYYSTTINLGQLNDTTVLRGHLSTYNSSNGQFCAGKTGNVYPGFISPMSFINGILVDASLSGSEVINDGSNFGFSFVMTTSGSSVISSGIYGYIKIPYSCKIDTLNLLADVSTTTTVQIATTTYDTYPTTNITSDFITISGTTKSVKTTNLIYQKGDFIEVRILSLINNATLITLAATGVKL